MSLPIERQRCAQQNAASAGHRLGETADQFAARYGASQDSPGLDKNFPLLEGAIHHTYAYEGWRIRAAFVPPDGPAVRMEYSKIVKAWRRADDTGLRIASDHDCEHARRGQRGKKSYTIILIRRTKVSTKFFEGLFWTSNRSRRCGNAATARSYGCAAKLLSALSFLLRAITKRNSKRKRNRKPANQFRSSDVKY